MSQKLNVFHRQPNNKSQERHRLSHLRFFLNLERIRYDRKQQRPKNIPITSRIKLRESVENVSAKYVWKMYETRVAEDVISLEAGSKKKRETIKKSRYMCETRYILGAEKRKYRRRRR